MITLLTYDAPHYKSERFLLELVAHGLKPSLVVGAPWRKLNLPAALRTHVRHEARHPAELCVSLGIPYEVKPHGELAGGELAVVGGARILKAETISRFSAGVLNLHPGAIPENRGLSNIARAVRDMLPPTVTAHLIDGRVDAGRVIRARTVRLEADDAVGDLAERMLDVQVHMLAPAVRHALTRGTTWEIPADAGGYEPPLSSGDEAWIISDMWREYVERHSG